MNLIDPSSPYVYRFQEAAMAWCTEHGMSPYNMVPSGIEGMHICLWQVVAARMYEIRSMADTMFNLGIMSR